MTSIGIPNDYPVVVVGAGQAGLAVSHELTTLGIDHVVLERARIGQAWRGRWDSFCLVTPNWTMSLPGAPTRATLPRASSLVMRLSATWNGMHRPSRRPFARE
jgi:cation diffusion facilitator CzcD-associated flavoprotein CzcO